MCSQTGKEILQTSFSTLHQLDRENTSRMVDCVSGATFHRLPSGTVISQGRQMVVTVIENRVVRPVGKMPPATVLL